ncbi:GerMN domain-containing protein [Gelria sp. Kuro-4]|uniref:GerMN domain-containing protein n=1 Tax=Gelria sp. Kuro-4 TaxID=2796927 RepID=UPI001BEF2113|nr:GerMN domain-containing protein [Gelria sp. Kuro-4]BCV23941.1 hypothetical protein kuro4_07140 [Gelria sp. Kuro-4]
MRRGTKIALLVLALVAAAALAWAGGAGRPHPAPSPGSPPAPPDETKTVKLKLHFVYSGSDHVVTREVPATRAVARAALQELLKGYLGTAGEVNVLPPGTQLRDIAILDGIAYVDFSREFRDNHWGGVASEVDTIYSVVNTLGEFPTVRGVQFLLEGSPLRTIGAGVVDLAQPLKPRRIAPSLYTQLAARLVGPAARALPWNAWVKSEERLALREGFPDALALGDTDGDGADELVLTAGKRVGIWDREAGGFASVWERKFSSAPRVVLAATRAGSRKDLVVAAEEGIFIFGWGGDGYVQLGWQGVSGNIQDLAVGDTDGNGRAEILALFGRVDGAGEELAGGRIVIWEWNGETYLRRREEAFSFLRLLPADVNGDGRDEILAFARRGVTVFGWQGAAYVELGSNPAAGGALATVLAGDVNGDGHADLVVRDEAAPSLYVYSWQRGGFSKLWQGPPAGGQVLGREAFIWPAGGGYPTLLVAGNNPGSYVFLRAAADGWQQQGLVGASGEQVLGFGDVDGDGAPEVIFRRHQLLSNPVQWLYIGRLSSLSWPAPAPQDKAKTPPGRL